MDGVFVGTGDLFAAAVLGWMHKDANLKVHGVFVLRLHVYVCACVHMTVYMHACVYVCVCMCARARMHVYMHAYMHVCVTVCVFNSHCFICLSAWLSFCLSICLPAGVCISDFRKLL